ncbi:hypothetical protein EIP91_000051 [Steccherinum ochraceum]|uniref:Secreted protein n=1 Tax=Steccherinum ochraceum TaxID=92696 RepID=A0A4R0RZI9_9APHY|nr:hypothetical protein EIP91_000051 [Steccherinum ochraceum]
MRVFSFATTIIVALLGPQVFAAPLRPNNISKRDDICKVKVSDASNNDCMDSGSAQNYAFTKPSSVANAAVSSVPSGSTCNQIIETQLVNNALNDHKICALLFQMKIVQKDFKKEDLLEPLSDIINSKQNLNFLANDVEKKKSEVVSNGMKGKTQSSDDIHKAVGNYLQLTKSASQEIARQLDGKIQEIFTKAKAIHDTLDSNKPLSRLQMVGIEHALGAANKTTTPITDSWNKVLESAPHS